MGTVNCGGVGAIETPMESGLEVFDRAISASARGAFPVTKCASQSIARLGKGGAIVNISSQAALIAPGGHISCAASKAAMDSVARVSALEFEPCGIRVSGVNPTAVNTGMTIGDWGGPEIGDLCLEKMPLGMFGKPDETAAPIVVLRIDGAAVIAAAGLPTGGGCPAC